MTAVAEQFMTERDRLLLSHGPPLILMDKWTVRKMELTPPKIVVLWGMLQHHKTLFSDLTRADIKNWLNYLRDPDVYWFEVYEGFTLVGIINFTDMHQICDCTAHMVFFDRKPAEKRLICVAIMQYMFENFPLQRMTVTPPAMYHATVRLIERLGFSREGMKREAVLIGGRWVDQYIYGITRGEVIK